MYAPEEEGQFQPGRCSRWWLSESLQSLNEELKAIGSRLLCYRGIESHTTLANIAKEVGADGVVFNHLYDPISMVRDTEVKATLSGLGIMCCSFNGDVLREPWEVVDVQGRPYATFDEFWSAHTSGPLLPMPLPRPAVLPKVPDHFNGMKISDLGIMTEEESLSNEQLSYHWSPGTAGARKLLANFVNDRLERFDKDRAKTDRNSTSRLSPHIHFGEISIRDVHAAVVRKATELDIKQSKLSVSDFLRQLGYREYSRYLSFHFPFTHERALLEHLRAIPWRLDQSLFKAWRTGTTGYPLVDAAMRELWSTGWMHNRMRVVCASFLVKNLLLPWQWGLKHYWDALLDADLECDALGWQYCAGCLVDAHPFAYSMDLETETKKFDPDGNFVRRWMPVLARLPKQYIHTPWKAPAQVLAEAGVELGVNYPVPVIEIEESHSTLAAAAAVIEASVNSKCCSSIDNKVDKALEDGRKNSVVHAGCKRLAPSGDGMEVLDKFDANNEADGNTVPEKKWNVDCGTACLDGTHQYSYTHRSKNDRIHSRLMFPVKSPYRPATSLNPSAAAMVWGSHEESENQLQDVHPKELQQRKAAACRSCAFDSGSQKNQSEDIQEFEDNSIDIKSAEEVESNAPVAEMEEVESIIVHTSKVNHLSPVRNKFTDNQGLRCTADPSSCDVKPEKDFCMEDKSMIPNPVDNRSTEIRHAAASIPYSPRENSQRCRKTEAINSGSEFNIYDFLGDNALKFKMHDDKCIDHRKCEGCADRFNNSTGHNVSGKASSTHAVLHLSNSDNSSSQ